MTLLLFLLTLSILVLVHELGHFLMAKKSGVLVEEFGFGLPPRIWGKKIGETIYSINALPIGGFVKLFGEEGLPSPTPSAGLRRGEGRAFFEKTKRARLGVILAGVVMNFLLAVIVFSVIYFVMGIPVKTSEIKIVGIAKGSPADSVGLKIEDKILSLDGQRFENIENFVNATKEKAGKVIKLEINREKDNPCKDQKILGGGVGPPSPRLWRDFGEAKPGFEVSCQNGNLLISVVPRVKPPEGEGPLGVAISEMEMKYYPWWLMPFYGIREGFKESVVWGKMVFESLISMFKNLIFLRQIPKEVAGPIGIYQATGMVAKSGILAILEFLGILSVNLAIINVLPFPALDGGRLVFLGIEVFFGRKIAPKVEAWINNLGMAILLFLLLLVTINDIARILTTNHILEKIKVIF